MINIEVIHNNKKHDLHCKKNTNLLHFLRENGFNIAANCNGNGTCKKCMVHLNNIPVLACQTYINKKATVTIPSTKTIQTNPNHKVTHKFNGKGAFALDIGTTTLALALIDLENSSVTEIVTANNPQSVYGADIISRIHYSSTPEGLKKLHTMLIDSINKIIISLMEKYKIKNNTNLYIAANTTMLHFLFGVDCTSIGKAPYKAAFLESRSDYAKNLGICLNGTVKSLPSIHSFVGSDLVSGLQITEKPINNKYNLLVDLGTNAEIMLFSETKLLCTAAAAGPCFEGANIKHGMSATSGAIDHAEMINNTLTFTTIKNAPAKGLCGSGLIDLIAILVKENIIDENGTFSDKSYYNITERVCLIQDDIRNFQVAKSAVMSAIEALLAKAKITQENVDSLYLSGGFSTHINIENIGICGLISKKLLNKCKTISNSSLEGLIFTILNNKKPKEINAEGEYIDLTNDTIFAKAFIYNMNFQYKKRTPK